MNLLFFLRFSEDKAFADQLATQLAQELPPGLMERSSKALSVNKVTRLLERSYQAAAAYQTKRGMGFIRRAVLANSFKWNLRNKGYADDFVDMATEGLVVELSRTLRKSS
jgi:hypothetical protein